MILRAIDASFSFLKSECEAETKFEAIVARPLYQRNCSYLSIE